MPSAWLHATEDLIAFGQPYFDLHQRKDLPYKILGPKHRLINHAWYHECGNLWSFSDPFPPMITASIQDLLRIESPDEVEEQMVSLAHDNLDRVWDDLSYSERKYWESFFAWLVFNPSVLKNWAGVDVLNGRIQRIVDDREIWEYCPELKSNYQRLRSYVEVVIARDKKLQRMIRLYG